MYIKFLTNPYKARVKTNRKKGENTPLKAVPETEEESKSVLPIQVGMMEYYLPGKSGGVPRWKNALSLYNFESLLIFPVFNVTHLLDNGPFFMAYGTEAYTVDNNEEFFSIVKGPKEKFVVQGAGHFDLYWKPKHVDPIVQRIAAFFKKHMKQN